MPAFRLTLPARGRLWWIYLLTGALLTGLYVFVPPFKGSGPVINALGLSGVLAVVAGIRVHRPRGQLAWWCFVGGLLLFWIGDVYTYSYRILFHATIPFPSWGDAVYLAVYPVLMVGLLVLVRRRNRQAGGPGLIDSLIMTLGLSLVSFVLLIAPYIHDAGLPLLPKLVSVAYPTGDIICLAAAIRLAVDGGTRRTAFYLLIASIVCLLTTDSIYGLTTLHNDYHHQLWLDVGWIFFYLFWGAAALHPSMSELADAAPERQPRLTPVRLALLAGATLIAPVLEMTKAIRDQDSDLRLIVAGSIVLYGLVVGRMAGLVRQREQSVARERALTASGGRLVGATSRREISAAALKAVHDLGAGGEKARLCQVRDKEILVEAIDADGAMTRWAISRRFASALVSPAETDVVVLDPIVRRQLRLPDADEQTVILGLGSQGRGDTSLVVAGQAATAPETRYTLQTLASQVALALESAELSDEIHRRVSDARLSALVQNSSDLITVIGPDLTILYQSPSIERILGYTVAEVTGGSFERLLHPGEQGRLLRRLTDGAGAARARSEGIECLLAHRDGSLRHFEILQTNLLEDSAVQGIVLNGRDVSERNAFEEQLSRQAFRDPVTHLANRALFNERARHAVARGRREQIGLAVIFVDLDDFKTVNDSLGHAAGDSVLREVGRRISLSVRAADTAARFGGDEFAVLLEDVHDLQSAAETADRILESLRRPIQTDHSDLIIRASLGLSVAEPEAPIGADELIRNADAAMYIAKAEGNGGYRIFEPAMHERVLARLELRADLQRALDRDEFELHYQPLVRLEDGEITGVEALLRWRHPTRGVIAPSEFIPFAEETGLIVPIGRWVLYQGCRQAKAFRDEMSGGTAPNVGINLSVKQLFHDDIVADVSGALAAAGLEPDALTLEITESVMMTDTELAVRRLHELRNLGVRLAMDDFGTGYSSLSYLSRFPIDILKMDRSLLAAGASAVTSGLASAVLGLGETFQLEVVAEGIELSGQSETLRHLGCEIGQGFLFARPMPPEHLVEFVRSNQASMARPAAVSGTA